jgi:PAS domain-containing protein
MIRINSPVSDILNSDYYIQHGEILLDCFNQFSGEPMPLNASGHGGIKDLYHAPFAVVSHGIQTDPIFNFANQFALDLFELSFEDFIQLPSRKSAEFVERQEREKLLDEVSANNIIHDYRGVRISASGKRFMIERAIVWNLFDHQGGKYGQAAMFRNWTAL